MANGFGGMTTTHKHSHSMIRFDRKELGRMKEKDLAMFYEGLCSVKFPNQKPRSLVADYFGVKTRTYDKIKQGTAHAPAIGWLTASKELGTTLWLDWLEELKKKIQ